jgi:hypothetical protein
MAQHNTLQQGELVMLFTICMQLWQTPATLALADVPPMSAKPDTGSGKLTTLQRARLRQN